MTVDLEIQLATKAKTLPHPNQFKNWVGVVLDACKELVDSEDLELTIRVVDEAEMSELNARYCNKNKPTNVLAFAAELPPDQHIHWLGDIVICSGVVEKEAMEQGKEWLSHWAHMVIHGLLHLLGYDHKLTRDAKVMEKLEIKLMQDLGYLSPY